MPDMAQKPDRTSASIGRVLCRFRCPPSLHRLEPRPFERLERTRICRHHDDERSGLGIVPCCQLVCRKAFTQLEVTACLMLPPRPHDLEPRIQASAENVSTELF